MLIVVGIVLRVVQYAANRSLWADEVLLTLDIVDHSLRSLFSTLGRNQVAPFGFLALEKGVVSVFGTGELALRLAPLAAGIASVPLFWSVARRFIPRGAALVALAAFSVSQPLIYLSSEVKQYSSDVFIALGLLWLGLHLLERPLDRRTLAIGASIGVVAVWISQVAAFTLAGVGIAVIAQRFRERPREAARGVAMASLWGASFVASYAVTRAAVPRATLAYMDRFWDERFIGSADGLLADVRRLWQVLARFFVDPLGYHTPYRIVAVLEPHLPAFPWLLLGGLALCAALVGGWALWAARQPSVRTLVFVPIVGLMAASTARAFPFGGRTSAFLIPFALLLIANGMWAAWTRARAVVTRAGVVVAAALLFVSPVREAVALPYHREELRDVAAYVADHRAPDDAVYVYYGALQPLEYYSAARGIRLGAYTSGVVSREDPDRYRTDIRRFAGARRVWIILSHDFQANGTSEWSVLLDELDRMGTRLECVERTGARACLYAVARAAEASPV